MGQNPGCKPGSKRVHSSSSNMLATSSKQAPNKGMGRPFGSKDKFPRQNQRALSEARKLQQIVFSKATEDREKTIDLPSLVRAWDILEERKRILKGVPSPGSLKPESPKPKPKPVASITPLTD